MNNKVRKGLYSIKGSLKNPHIPIPDNRILFSVIVIGKVSYNATLVGSNKERTRSTETLVIQNYTEMKDFLMGIVLHLFILGF